MLLNAAATFMLWLLLLPSSFLAAATAPGHFVVKLHRQRVPVKGQSDAVSYKNVYFGTVYLGGPAKQEFSVVFDTGSGHVVVPSTGCPSPTCKIHRRYSRKASPNAVDIDYDGTLVKPGAPRDQITVAYGTGEVTGQFVSERLCLSDTQAAPDVTSHQLRATSSAAQQAATEQEDCLTMRVVTATEMTHEPFHSFSFDGILGLGLEPLTLAPEFSFFGQLVAQGKVAQSRFGVFLADGEDEQSEICFGGHLPERLQSELLWSPVALPDLGYWQGQVNRVRIGNKTLDFCDDGQCRAVVDTGTSLLAVPAGFAEELQDELTANLRDPPTSTEHGIDCMLAEGALLHFDIEGLTVSLTAGDYARPAIMLHDTEEEGTEEKANDSEVETSQDIDNRMAEAKCQPTIMPIDMPAPIGPKLFIWGEPVLRRYYTVYDLAEKKIGFGLAAHRKPEPQIKPPPSSPRRPLLAV